MGILLLIIGIGWAVIGFGNIVASSSWHDPSTLIGPAGVIIFNAVLFIFPGLIVAALGNLLNRKHKE